ncbi:MAG: glycosyltransferase family 4 protein [bacterium]
MRILNSTTLHGWSAGSWYAVNMLGGLVGRGHDVHVLVREGPTAQACREAGMEVLHEPDLLEAGLWGARRTRARLEEMRQRLRPDVIVAHWGPDHTWWGLAAGHPATRTPLVRLRAHDPRPPARHPLSRWLHSWRTEAFIVANEPQRRAYTEDLRIPPHRVHRIPPGYQPAGEAPGGPSPQQVRARCGVGEGEQLVVSLARFAPQKDHATFFRAAALAAAAVPGLKFLAAGYPAEHGEERIRRLAARYALPEDRWTLWSERLEDGRPLVRAADIGVIHSSGSEAISRAAMEFMDEGIPLAATTVGSLPEVIHDWTSGLLVPPGEPETLAGALVRLARSGELRRRLARGARERLLEVFDPQEAVIRFEETLEGVVEEGAGVRR